MDITEQKEAQSKLEELEALEASILESIPHAVIGLREQTGLLCQRRRGKGFWLEGPRN